MATLNAWYPPGSAQANAITANQGTANTDANAWPVRITDGTHDATVTVGGALNVAIASGISNPLPVQDSAAEASLSSIDTKLTSQATATKQDTGNISLSSIDTKLSSQATATKQDTANASLASIDGKLTAPISVSISSGISNPLPVQDSAAEASLSSIDTKLTSQATAAKQDTGNTSLASIDTKLIAETISASGTLTGSNSVTLDVRGMGGVTAQVGIGLLSFGTVNFEGSVDGTNFFFLSASNLQTLDGQIPTDTSSGGVFAFNVAGLTTFRLSGGGTPDVPVFMRAQMSSPVVNQLLAITYTKDTNMAAKTASSDVTEAFDYRAIAYVGATQKIDTITYKSGGSGGSTVATQTFGYDGSDRLTSITKT